MIITLIITFLKEAPSNNFFRLFLKRAGQSKVGEGALGKCFRTNSRSTNLKKILTNYIFTWSIQSIIDFSGYEPLLNVKLLNFLSLYISKKKLRLLNQFQLLCFENTQDQSLEPIIACQKYKSRTKLSRLHKK